jgi:DMSO/TMAO reductase YedYZ molybdopterin-dependent catalytic subunit
MIDDFTPSRRTFLAAAAVGAATIAVGDGLAARAVAGTISAEPTGPILKPLPEEWFYDYGTNAEMRWDSVNPREYATRPARLFVRNHTSTPVIDRKSYALRVYGDGLATPRGEADALSLTLDDLHRLPTTEITSVHECTGNGRSFFGSQQGTPASGTPWLLGAVGTVRWQGVRLKHLLRRIGISPDAVSIQATGLDPNYVSGGVDYGPVRRPFPVSKALDDAILAWGMNGRPLLRDHGYPLRLVLPGWVGIGSIKWLGSLEVSASELTSPWNTKWYRMTGGSYPADSPPLAENPVRSAWELPWNAELPRSRKIRLTGRSWSGAGRVTSVQVSTDGGTTWQPTRVTDVRRGGWTQWGYTWAHPEPGEHVLMARATDAAGRTQPLETPFNDGGYFFDAVVRHPVTVV